MTPLDNVTMFCYIINVTKHCYNIVKKKILKKGSDLVDLISKKELLQLTGISYGQLYRWKREKLIPEEWFIKQSSFTGQETFLPRELILPRVAAILENKDKYSLNELGRILSPETAPAIVNSEALAQISEIDADLLADIREICPKESYTLFDLSLFAATCQALTRLRIVENGERRAVLERAVSAVSQQTPESVLTVFLAGDYHAMLSRLDAPFAFDSTITEAVSIPVSECAATIKMKYRTLFPTLE